MASGSDAERDLASEFERESPSGTRDEANGGRLLLQPPPQQQQAALQVVLPVRQVQRLVQAQLAVGELLPPRGLALGQQPPEDFRRQAANQVFAVEQDALVRRIVDDGTPRR